MSRKLLRDCLTLLENVTEECSLSEDQSERAYQLIEDIKTELGFVAPVAVYKVLKEADDNGRLNAEYITVLSNVIAGRINSK